MIISVVGSTDKRPFIYTLMKICQSLGDTCLITNKRHYMRLIGGYDTEGSYQNISLFITDSTFDNVNEEINHNKEDYDFWIFENDPDPESDIVFYIKGYSTTEYEELILDALDSYIVINFGFGKENLVKYATSIFQNCEIIEATQTLIEVSPVITKLISEELSKKVGLPSRTLIRKVASR